MARAILSGMILSLVGWLPVGALSEANLHFAPRIPWGGVAIALWLWLLWRYLAGAGRSDAASAARRANLRAPALPAPVWRRALLAGGAIAVVMRMMLDLSRRLSIRPEQDIESFTRMLRYPHLTVFAIFLATAATAGVVEEAAFRGYIQFPIERRHGRLVGISVTALLFFVAHFRFGVADPIPWLTFSFAYLGAAVGLGLLASLSGSIVPGVLCHAVVDAAAFLQYAWLGTPKSVWTSGVDRGFVVRCVVLVAAVAVTVPALRGLAAVARREAAPGSDAAGMEPARTPGQP
jgi:membrane protease YdiL (CAAX protease family)